MPKTFVNSSEAKSSLLKQSKLWREEFKTIRESKKKAEDQALVKAIDGALDEIVSASAHVLDKQEGLEKMVERTGAGLEVALQLGDQRDLEINKINESAKIESEAFKTLQRKADDNERRTKASLEMAQALQLERASSGIICRNMNALVSRVETFEDLRRAFHTALAVLNYQPQVSFIRRLARMKGDTRNGPTAMLVNLASPGERAILYSHIDKAVKAGKQLNFSISSEVPRYAISTYKYMGKLASIVRTQYPELRTRVNIPKGEQWPAISVKHDDDNKFIKCSKDMLEAAKAEYVKAGKEKSDSRKNKKATAANSAAGAGPSTSSGHQPMETNNTRPKRGLASQKNNN